MGGSAATGTGQFPKPTMPGQPDGANMTTGLYTGPTPELGVNYTQTYHPETGSYSANPMSSAPNAGYTSGPNGTGYTFNQMNPSLTPSYSMDNKPGALGSVLGQAPQALQPSGFKSLPSASWGTVTPQQQSSFITQNTSMPASPYAGMQRNPPAFRNPAAFRNPPAMRNPAAPRNPPAPRNPSPYSQRNDAIFDALFEYLGRNR